MPRLIDCRTILLLSLLVAGCASSPTSRRQVVLYSDDVMASQGISTYEQMQAELPVETDSRRLAYVRCVTGYIVDALSSQERGDNAWEVTLFKDDQANAFALPGGKMGVFTGLLDVATNQHQLAAVMSHEVGHVLARHSNERASQAALRDIGLAAAQQAGVSDQTLQLIGFGANLGFFLPFNRVQESEADQIGIMLMARAGFDPQESINLWHNMAANGGSRPPEFLSTHPSPDTRIADLNRQLSRAEAQWLAARNQGRVPDCVAPD
ncbi:MAG: M48 family metallopeptidase [Pseudomonadales bacterium]|nr:M48 family metallopeptidase [Pseudomonadales bacterium]